MDMPTLLNSLPQTGTVDWIGLRGERKAKLQEVSEAVVNTSVGLENDHYSGQSGKRHVTLIQAEHLQAVASVLKLEKIDPQETRRNIVVSGINLLAFNNRQFQIGDEVILEMTGYCHPCSRMEENLGPGGYNAMRGHGGVTAKVIKGGLIKVGASVKMVTIPATIRQ